MAESTDDHTANVSQKRQLTLTDAKTLREKVFHQLDKNHELKPKELIFIMQNMGFPFLTHEKHAHLMRQYRYDWKRHYKNRHSLKCLNFHNARGYLYALSLMNRAEALGRCAVIKGVSCSWQVSQARNRMFVFRVPSLGRLEWFETGRVNFWVRKPATLGRVKQLLAYGFSWTGVIVDQQIFDLWVSSVKFKGAHLTVDAGEKLPYMKVDALKESNGVVVKMGDASHPTMLEIEFCYPNWQERNERLAELNAKLQEETTKMLHTVAENLKLSTEQQARFNELMSNFMQGGVQKPAFQRGLYE